MRSAGVLVTMIVALLWGANPGELNTQDQTRPRSAADTEKQFHILAQQWAEHCKSVQFSSNTADYLNAPSYRQLVALGPAAVPLIMESYRDDNLPWGFALQEITGIVLFNSNQFSFPQVRHDWQEWWKRNQVRFMAELSQGTKKQGTISPQLSPGQINHFGNAVSSAQQTPVYRLTLKSPLLQVPYGNAHIVDLRAQQTTLDIAIGWDQPSGEFNYAQVPWQVIRDQQVKYGLSEFYDPNGLPYSYIRNPIPADQSRRVHVDRSIPELRSVEIVGAKQNAGKNVYIFGQKQIIKLSPGGKVLWIANLPAGHTLIAFDVTRNLLLLATNSDQGFRDGELGIPFLTTQVFAVSYE